MRRPLPVTGSRARLREGPRCGPAAPKPPWLKVRLRQTENFVELRRLMRVHGLHTVCEESGPCPNIYECWEQRTATFLILGNVCTRRCSFCDVLTGRPPELDSDEPRRVAEAVAAVGLEYAVVTGVARDDILSDGGASIWAATIREIRARVPECGVEVLVPDFRGSPDAIAAVLEARPDVFAHNLETVRRLHRRVRPGFTYDRSLDVLRIASDLAPEIPTKSGMMLGLGEEPDEVRESIADIRRAGASLLTLGQYLAPSRSHPEVERYVPPEEFDEHADFARTLGFRMVTAGPLVRSSYHAKDQAGR